MLVDISLLAFLTSLAGAGTATGCSNEPVTALGRVFFIDSHVTYSKPNNMIAIAMRVPFTTVWVLVWLTTRGVFRGGHWAMAFFFALHLILGKKSDQI